MTETKTPKAVASGVTITLLGMITWQADVLPAKRSSRGSSGFRLVCPDCEVGQPAHQQYSCPNGHGPFTQDELHRAVLVDDEYCKVDDDYVAAVKGATPASEKAADFQVYPADQVEAATMPGESIYRLRPHGDRKRGVPAVTAQTYAMVLNLVDNSAVAFVANYGVRGATKMYRMINRDGILTMVELVRPGEFHAPIDVPTECDQRLRDTAAEFMKLQMTDFVPEDWSDRQAERAETMKATLVDSPTTGTQTAAPTENGVLSLMAQLEASVAAATPIPESVVIVQKVPRKKRAPKAA